MEIYDLVDSIKNVGEKRKKLLNKVGIYTIKDLLEYLPRDYEDRSVITPLSEVKPEGEYTVKARVMSGTEMLRKGRFTIVRAHISDGDGQAVAVWFNQPYLKNFFRKGSEYYFTGSFSLRNGRLTLASPDYEEVKEDNINSGRIIPKYHLTKDLGQKLLRKLISETLTQCVPCIKEFIPEYIRREYSLAGRTEALFNIHFPESREKFFAARRRLVFEELLILQLELLRIKGEIKRTKTGIPFKFSDADAILDRLPFRLTEGQEEALSEITEDMSGEYPMNRLLQGDVGSGKTAVAQICAYIAYTNGAQTAVMAPTDVLATQHYYTFSELFGRIGIETVLLKSSLAPKEKKKIKEMIKDGSAHIVIGTHALIQNGVEFKELGLVITDEQHRFGVNQRKKLASKGKNPHTLVMSATPIPRTLGLILYGDLDISTIRTMPAGRKKIDTSFVDSSYRDRIYRFILKNINEGKQAYIVCPSIEENSKTELASVKKYALELENTCLRNVRRGLVHGKMKSEEKQLVMKEFSEGNIDVLIATTVIEVGINVPRANVMLIENAERFGLSQLHQLRGRVGRGEYKSYCILVSDKKQGETAERLRTMVNNSDGFDLSEKDLELRGPGDFFGTRQHGLPELKIANLYRDIDILKEVQALCERLYAEDRFLEREENRPLKERLDEFFVGDDGGLTV